MCQPSENLKRGILSGFGEGQHLFWCFLLVTGKVIPLSLPADPPWGVRFFLKDTEGSSGQLEKVLAGRQMLAPPGGGGGWCIHKTGRVLPPCLPQFPSPAVETTLKAKSQENTQKSEIFRPKMPKTGMPPPDVQGKITPGPPGASGCF